MDTPIHAHHSFRAGGVLSALAAIVLLGCARKVQIEVPADFHGQVHILCSGLSEDRSTNIRVGADGTASVDSCPLRQTSTVVSRAGGSGPISTNVMWTTTGDGLVREINFTVK